MPDDNTPENESSVDPALKAKIDEIHNRYAPRYAEIEADAKKLSEGAPEGYENAVGIDIDWSKWHEISFDVPEFRMKLQKISFDVPEVTMKRQRWVWHTPRPGMKRVQVGVKPEFHGFKVKFTPMYMDVPYIEMQKCEAKLDVPEFKMKRKDVSAHIPDVFRMRRVSFRIPEIKIRKTADETGEMQEGAAELQKTAEGLAAQQRAEVVAVSKDYLLTKRDEIKKQYDAAIAQYAEAINQAKAAGVDPTKPITADDGTQVAMTGGLDEITRAFEGALRQIDEAIVTLDTPAVV